MADLRGIRTLEQVDLAARRVLIRADLDVDVSEPARDDGDLALRATLESARFALEAGARVIIAGHRGEPPGHEEPKLSVEPVAARLAELGGLDVLLPDDCLSDAAKRIIFDLRDGQVCVLENLGFYAGEADRDEAFARQIASYADVYVNEAFGACPLDYASLTVLPKLFRDRATGKSLTRELTAFEELRASASKLTLVLGGPTVQGSFDVAEALLSRAKTLLFGVKPALTLLAASGASIPEELVDSSLFSRARTLLAHARDRGVECQYPTDWAVTREATEVFPTAGLPHSGQVSDVGPLTLERFQKAVAAATHVVVTGSLGLPIDGNRPASDAALARSLADAPGFTVALADDTERLLISLDEVDRAKINHISTNGSAASLLLQGHTLPGVEALRSGGIGS